MFIGPGRLQNDHIGVLRTITAWQALQRCPGNVAGAANEETVLPGPEHRRRYCGGVLESVTVPKDRGQYFRTRYTGSDPGNLPKTLRHRSMTDNFKDLSKAFNG